MIFIYGLIFLFALLISYQLFLGCFNNTLIEGLENETPSDSYKAYDKTNALILSQQNAGNIDYLNGRVTDLSGIKQQVNTMQSQMTSMQSQIDELVNQQASYAQDLIGNTPVEITGTGTDST
jgi:TolA-binding protein